MCIRDRPEGLGMTVLSPTILLAGVVAAFINIYRNCKTFYPVSYTHLRAHETVLDLVCRLLLEKKNKQYYKLSIQGSTSCEHYYKIAQT